MIKGHGIDRANLDETVDPRQDFYQYGCGGWKTEHPLEGEYSSFGVFTVLSENARDNVRDLIAGLSEDPEAKKKGTIAQKVGDLYAMGMDSERREREGNRPLQPVLERLENFTRDKFAETTAWLYFGLDNTFFSFGVGPDLGNSDMNILHISEAGLGLGDRDYYLEHNETNERIMAAYRKYIHDLMKLAGYDDDSAQRISDNVVEIETEFARHKMTREERRDPLKRYHIMSLDEVSQKYSNIPWNEIFKLTGITEIGDINVSSPAFMEFINEYLPKLSERQMKDMMIYGSVSSSSGALSEEFYNVGFEMFGRVMSGTEEKRPLWKRAQGIVTSMFGEAIGQLYVKKHFPEENKKYMVGLVENLRDALEEHISELSWMSEETKSKAIAKLKAMKAKIGYPDKWKDYSEIEIDPEKPYMDNLLKASEWFVKDGLSKLGKEVDKEEWFMYPQTVNAYYSPQMNEICFPAGILQPPFFDITADHAQNYGAIGVVIGHEMTHGFDDSGRRYDIHGNLSNWWTAEDEEKFKSLTEGLVRQFDEVEVAPGVHANGTYTLGENIADQGGLRVALTAYQKALEKSGEIMTEIDGFTALQRFYLSFAGVWANNIRPEEILARTQSDPHSLAENRVNVTLRNIEPFMQAFGVKEGDAMYRPESERVIIW